ncbi:MAG: Dabb family protein [Pirellulales bacterium]|nr:Dabb family protein [Pirellulales bacterium]
MIAHDVYFTLKQDSDDAKEKLVAGCRKYLSDHPGVVWFAAGVLVGEHQREVNDRDFHVALHIVFKDKASHDRYQKADRHHRFIEEFQENWKTVRVFDSYLNVSSHGEMEEEKGGADRAKKPRLPDPASQFAGMVQGKVVSEYDEGDFTLAVTGVPREWRHSKAESAESLIGKTVLVVGRQENGESVAKFIRSLKIGEVVTLDVAHRGKGEALTILELTKQQRQRVK